MSNGASQHQWAVQLHRHGLRPHCLHVGHAADPLGRTNHRLLAALLGTTGTADAGNHGKFMMIATGQAS